VRPAVVVFVKECIDNLRDRRALSTALLLPLMGPFSLWLMFLAVADVHEKRTAPKVPVQGRAHAPTLVAALERDGLQLVDAPVDAVAAVKKGDVDLVLVIPPHFGDDLRAGRPAAVELIVDPSRQSAAVAVGRVRTALATVGQQVGALRLLARGIDPAIVQPVQVAVHDVGTPQARGAFLLASLPLFLLLGCFLGGTYVAIDATAGERERGSLEALLLNPAPAHAIIAGKLAATVVFSVVGVVVSAVGFVVAARVLPFAEVGISLELRATTAALLVGLLVPMAVLGAAVQIFVGTLSQSFKTAQAAISFVSLAPAVPGALLAVFPQQPTPGLLLLPSVGHALLMDRLLRGEALAAGDVLLAVSAVLVVAAVLAGASVHLFGPRLVAGR
jgi:sodium transport system permease protein